MTDSSLDPGVALLLAWGAYGAPALTIIGVACYLWRSWRRRCRGGGAPPGTVVLHGRATAIGGEEELVRVALVLRLVEARTAFWKEVERTITAVPFRLLLQNGQVVRVDPDNRTAIAEFDRVDESADRRLCVARLLPGEEVHVAGVMSQPLHAPGGPHRSAGEELRLVPSARGGILIGHRPLSTDACRVARFHRLAAFVLSASFIATHVLFLAPYDKLPFVAVARGGLEASRLWLAAGVFLFLTGSYVNLARMSRPWYAMRVYFESDRKKHSRHGDEMRQPGTLRGKDGKHE